MKPSVWMKPRLSRCHQTGIFEPEILGHRTAPHRQQQTFGFHLFGRSRQPLFFESAPDPGRWW